MAVDDSEILDAVRDVPYPVARAKDVAERVAIGKRAVLNRLEDLHEDGPVERLDVGARSAVWWVEREEPDDGPVDVDDLPERDRELIGDARRDQEGDDLDVGGVDVDWDSLDLPGSGAKLDERREAVRAAVAFLVDEGVASRSDFEREVYPDFPARYTSGENPGYSWWNNCIIDGLTQVAEQSELVEKPDYAGDWQYLG